MLETAACSNRATYFGASTPRTLTWITETHFYGLGCSRCAWLFRPTGPPTGSSLAEMKENYMQHCNQEFAAHDCAEQPRAAKTSAPVNQSSRSRSIEGRSARRKLRSGASDRQSSRSMVLRLSRG
jgi:hypothetical protein